MNTRPDPKPGPALYRYRFGTAEFDEARLDLRVGGLRVDVEQRPLQVLLSLLRRAGEVTTKEELFHEVWAGRPTVDNVLANAVAKLRRSLGEADAELVQTVPRIGYRITGAIERIAVGRRLDSRLDLAAGTPVPGRPHFQLERQLGPSRESEVWLAHHAKTPERRVYKFSTDGARLAALKREATLYRVLSESLGKRTDMTQILDWNFETAPFFLESAYGGISLAEWAASAHSLTAIPLDERIRLFVQIADAVAAAHSVGVLHKDLKPANVLIADPNAAVECWRLSLTDFGSGRLIEPERLYDLGITQLGLTHTQPFDSDSSGTLLYIAPEIWRGQPPTVQSDVYSLGVMLFQLAVADLRRPMTSGWERDLQDDLLREDIAAATDGDPQRRLKTAAELAEHLRSRDARRVARQGLDLVAARATQTQRALERTRARRPWVVAAMSLLALGLGISLWFYRSSRESERQLAQQFQVADALNTFMTRDLIGAANPAVSGHADVKMIDAAKAAIPRIDTAFATQAPAIQAALHGALQQSLSGLTDSEASIQEADKAIAAYERVDPPDLAHADQMRLRKILELLRLGRFAETDPLLSRVEHDLPDLLRRQPLMKVEFLSARAQIASSRSEQAKALGDDEASWRLLQTMNDPPPDLLNRVQFNLANSLEMVGRYRESDLLLRDLIVRQSQTLGPKHQQTLYSTVMLANNLLLEHRSAEARETLLPAVAGLEAALGPSHGRTLLAKRVVANAYLNSGQYAEAARAYGEVYGALVGKFGDLYQNSISTLEWRGESEKLAGDLTSAEASLRLSLANSRRAFAESSAMTQHIKYMLADCLLELKRPQEVGALLEGLTLDGLQEAEVTPDWPARLNYQQGRAALARGDKAAARRLLQSASDDIQNPGDRRWDELPKRVSAALHAANL